MMRVVGFIALLCVSVLALASIWFHGHVAIVPVLEPSLLRLDFAVTPLAIPFLALLALVLPGVAIWNLARGRGADGVVLALFAVSMLCVLVAQSVAAFVLAWEVMSLVSTFLVATMHEKRAVQRAVLSYVLISQLGVLCITTALAILALHAQSYEFAGITAHALSLSPLAKNVVLTLGLVGFGSKAGLMPLQFWLPRAHPAAPAAASALLSGIMLKVAIYGVLVLVLQFVAPVPVAWSIGLLCIGLITTMGGALYASVENDIKRILAYSSIENMGIIISGIGFVLLALAFNQSFIATIALLAVLFHALNHGLFKSLLFLGAGTIAQTAGATDLRHLGGLLRILPATGVAVLVGCMAASALPPLNGFVSEWLLFASFLHALLVAPLMMQAFAAVAIAAVALGSGLAAAAYSKLFGIAMLGERRELRDPHLPTTADLSWLGLTWLGAGCLLIGIIPTLALHPLMQIVTGMLVPSGPIIIPMPPLALGVLPLLGVLLAIIIVRVRGVRRVPTWTCGSPVTFRAQTTATSFANPILVIFASLLRPQRTLTVSVVAWFPERIEYETRLRYLIDETARNGAALVQTIARRLRIVQGGRLRVYLAYALVAVLIMLAIAR